MSPAAALLLAVFTAAPSSATPGQAGEVWAEEQVAQRAAVHAPAARLLESERRAIGCGVDRDDPSVCAQIGLIQSVYGSLAAHQQNEAAADARAAYWQAVALREQRELLDEAVPLIDSLDQLAATAERLELPDGDRNVLAERRFELEDRWFQADVGLRRLRNQLAALSGATVAEAQAATLTDPLPGGSSGSEPKPDVEQAIEVALTHRRDLQAIETLCRCTTAASLPAVRDLFGVLSPGLGLAARAAAAPSRLLALHAPEPFTKDIACRQSQCRELLEARREQIRFEVRDAVLQIELAASRLDVARRRLTRSQETSDRAARATELEQQPPGSETTARLEILERRGELVQRQLALAEAIVALERAQGTAATVLASR